MLSPQTYDDIVFEAVERINCFNVPKTSDENSLDADNRSVVDILRYIQEENQYPATSVHRIGKRLANKPRMIKVSFSSPKQVLTA